MISTFLKDVTINSIESIPENSAVYKFYSENTFDRGYLLHVGCTYNLRKSATAFLAFFQTLEIKDDMLVLEYYLSDDWDLLRDLNRKLTLKYQNVLPSLPL